MGLFAHTPAAPQPSPPHPAYYLALGLAAGSATIAIGARTGTWIRIGIILWICSLSPGDAREGLRPFHFLMQEITITEDPPHRCLRFLVDAESTQSGRIEIGQASAATVADFLPPAKKIG